MMVMARDSCFQTPDRRRSTCSYVQTEPVGDSNARLENISENLSHQTPGFAPTNVQWSLKSVQLLEFNLGIVPCSSDRLGPSR